MVFTTYGREQVALMLGSDLTDKHITQFAVGEGSGTELVSNETLIDEFVRFDITGSPDFSEGRKVLFTGDLDSLTASGLSMTEFGLFATGAAGSLFSREQIVGSIVADGTIELRIESAFEVM